MYLFTEHRPFEQLFLFWCLTAVFTFVFSSVSPPSLAKDLSDGIAAIVNSEVITLSELEEELRDEKVRLRARFQGEELEQRLLQKEYEALNKLIEQKLQLQEARAKGLQVTDDELQNALNRMSQPGALSGQSPEESREQLREELVLRKLLDFEVRRLVMVYPEEIRDHYSKFKNQFLTPPKYRLSQILILPKPGEDFPAAQARARSIYTKLKQGAGFSDLAKRYSDGPEGARGGDLGYLEKGELLAPLAQTLDSLKREETSQPIQTNLGFHIIVLKDVQPPKARPFEEVKDQIRNLLLQQKTKEVYQVWLSDLKEKAYIEVKF